MLGQTSMVAIMMGILMLMFIMIFLVLIPLDNQPIQNIRSEYRNLYAHSLLLSLLRLDTDCGQLSDVIKGAYFGGGRCDSTQFLLDRMPSYVTGILFETGHPDYDWYLECSPKDFQGGVLAFGNPGVKESNVKWDARTMITWEGYQLEVIIYMKTK